MSGKNVARKWKLWEENVGFDLQTLNGNFFFLINLFILFIFGRVRSLLRARASHCGGFSCCGARALGTRAPVVVPLRLSSCGLRALERRLSSCGTRA